MAYIQNQSLSGVKDGSNKIFTTPSNTIEIDSIYFKNTQLVDYEFTAPNTVELEVAPESTDVLVASYWTVGSLIGSGSPYEKPSTLDDMLFRVRTMIGEHYSEEWLDRSITNWLNEAINMICVKADFPFMEAEAHINTVAGQEAYQLPAGFKKIIKVMTGSTELPKADSREDISSSYALFNDVIILPQPTTSVEYKIRYYCYLPYFVWTDQTTTCKIPRQYESVLVDYAVMRAKEAEEIYDVARIHEEKFNRGIDAMVVDLLRRVEADWPSIRPSVGMY